MKLISEHFSDDVEYITEEKEDGKKNYKLKGVFLQAEIKNRNGRVYPMEVLEKEVKRYNEEFIKENRAYGELGHPDGPTVNLDKVSHMVTSLEADGKNFIGEAKVMSTPMGKIVTTLSESGVKLGVSSRGSGNVNESGEVQGFEIITVDIVAQPSAPDAYPKAIYEGLWNMRGGQKLYGLGQASMFDPRAQKHLADSITKLIEELNKK